MIRKFLVILFAFCLCFTSLAACAPDEEQGDDPSNEEQMYDPYAGVDLDSEELYLVKDGVAQYQIVTPADALPVETFAANELSNFIAESTGVRLSIVSDANVAYDQNSKFVSIGKTKLLEESKLDVDYSALNEEGFFIETKGNLILMDGANERGTLYSVYDFLEKFIGIRFLTEDSTYIPELEELAVHQMKIREAPYFANRTYSSANLQQNTYFAAQCRMSDIWAITPEQYGGGYYDDAYQPNDHSVFDLMPPSVYGEEHEDWYCYSTTSLYEGGYSQLCLTNEEMIQQAIINLKQWVEARPDAKNFMIGQADMNPFCNCKDCTDSYAENGGKAGTLLIFINRLADAIKEAYPERDITIQTFAYQESLQAPVKYVDGEPVPVNKNVVPRDNVMVKIAIDKACFFHPLDDETCTSNITPYKSLQEWSSLTDRLLMWDYTTNFSDFLCYFANVGILKQNILTYGEYGVERIFTQNSCQSKEHYQGQLKCYLFSKLLWNPYRDVNALVKEFNTLHFGADVEPYIAEVQNRMDMHYKFAGYHGICNGSATYFSADKMPAKLLEDCIDILEEAIAVVNASDRTAEEKETVITRIKAFLVTPQFMLLRNYQVYYMDDLAGRTALAEDFFANMEEIGMTYWKESGDNLTENLKSSYLN